MNYMRIILIQTDNLMSDSKTNLMKLCTKKEEEEKKNTKTCKRNILKQKKKEIKSIKAWIHLT